MHGPLMYSSQDNKSWSAVMDIVVVQRHSKTAFLTNICHSGTVGHHLISVPLTAHFARSISECRLWCLTHQKPFSFFLFQHESPWPGQIGALEGARRHFWTLWAHVMQEMLWNLHPLWWTIIQRRRRWNARFPRRWPGKSLVKCECENPRGVVTTNRSQWAPPAAEVPLTILSLHQGFTFPAQLESSRAWQNRLNHFEETRDTQGS